jgi:hypothetical protein
MVLAVQTHTTIDQVAVQYVDHTVVVVAVVVVDIAMEVEGRVVVYWDIVAQLMARSVQVLFHNSMIALSYRADIQVYMALDFVVFVWPQDSRL